MRFECWGMESTVQAFCVVKGLVLKKTFNVSVKASSLHRTW